MSINIDDHLVTPGNPARDLSGMDWARCAALHNYLVHYAYAAEGRSSAHLEGSTFFTVYGAAAEACRPRLDPSVASFLDNAIVQTPGQQEVIPFFFYAHDIPGPEDYGGLFDAFFADIHDQPPDSVLCLYGYNIGQAGGGLFYHQRHFRCAMFMHMDDYDYAMPIPEHQELWHPLETVLSHWIELIRIGKVVASPREEPSRFGVEKFGPWEWMPYSEAQVDSCVAAWDRLCEAIERRRAVATGLLGEATMFNKPLLTHAALDEASVPAPSFVRDFATRARRPSFERVAPGLVLPPTNQGRFAGTQAYSLLARSDVNLVPPVLLFPVAPDERLFEVDMTKQATGQYRHFYFDRFAPFNHENPEKLPAKIPAGVYIVSTERDRYDVVEDGFRLLLPYTLAGGQGNPREAVSEKESGGGGARMSDGSFVPPGSMEDLFQHGYKPLGGDTHRPQRLERLFDHWRRLVADGVWDVGVDGVEGPIETFRDADSPRYWREYVIPPSW